MPFVDLTRDAPPANFVLPGWLEKKRVLAIVDALNRGTDESDSDGYGSDGAERDAE